MKKTENKLTNSQIKKARFLELYPNNSYKVVDTCKTMGISVTTYYYWQRTDQEFAQLRMQAKQSINDTVEGQLIKKAEGGNIPAIQFYLKHNHEDYKDTKTQVTDSRKITINYTNWTPPAMPAKTLE